MVNHSSEGAAPGTAPGAESRRTKRRHIDFSRSNSALCRPGGTVGAGHAR
ncbi:hypothetical protein J2S68_002302 [Glycomyces algeriensis]|nr:hypothetical protein [Glycomyces algeriensis]